ncbi:MAG: hypothetical protein U5L96_13960 [Owenweeksia sp.]|nr:hypothetical protein [Owenweeksia sp.]
MVIAKSIKPPTCKNTRDLLVLNGEAFVGDANGLHVYNFNKGSWRSYTTANGLPHNMVRSLEPDTNGMIWCSTDYGLARLNPSDGSIQSIQSPKLLSCLSFNSRASATGRDGRIYFGCDEGITYFEPDVFKDNPYQPPVCLTGVALYNQELAVVRDSVREYRATCGGFLFKRTKFGA